MARLAIAIEDDWPAGEGALLAELDDRTAQAAFRSRNEAVLLYRHVAKTFIMFLGLGRVAGFTAGDAGAPVWRFDDLRRFATPVVSDAELQAPRARRMLLLSPERFGAIIEQGAALPEPGQVAEAAAPFDTANRGRSPELYLAVHDEVLRRFGYRCAISGRQFAPGARPHAELRVVEIRPRRLGGPLHAANYLPMVELAEPAWRSGAISVGPRLDFLAVLDRLPPDLLDAMRPEGRLLVPDDPALWPSAEHLAFHRSYLFGR